MSGFSYSSPIFFQNATSAKIDWYFSRSFALRILAAASAFCETVAGAGACACGAIVCTSDATFGRLPFALVSVDSEGPLPLGGAAFALSAASSASGSTSASITRRPDFVRNWLRNRRTVSRFASTSSVPPLMKPATSTRRNAETSIFGESGVSMGTSKKLVHPLTTASRARLAIVAALRAVIDFFEEIVVLANQNVFGIEGERLLIRLARVVETPFVLVTDPEIVPGRGVARIDLGRLFEAVDRLFPETVLRHLVSEVHLRFRVRPGVSVRRLRQPDEQ